MKSVFNRTVAIAAICISVPSISPSANAADTHKLEEIVITSSRVPMPLRQVGTSVSRVDEQEIAQRGFIALTDILRTVPGVGVSNSGGLGKPTVLRVRGEESFRTLVLIDGMDISDPTPPQMSPRLQHLPSVGIAAVEILRGPQGMMYGADAGGVVSIQTIKPDDGLHTGLRIDAGRYNTQQAFADVGARAEAGDFYLSGSRVKTDGFNTRSDDTVLADDDGYENTTLHSRLGWNIADSVRLQAVVRDVSARNEYDACYAYDNNLAGFTLTHDCNNDFDQRSARLSLDYSGEGITQGVAWQQSDLESRDYAAGGLSLESQGELRKIEYLGSLALNEQASLVFGFDHKEESIASGNENLARDQLGYYLEYQGAYWERLYITAGLRRDDNDDFGKHTSYRWSAAYVLPVAEGNLIKFKASAGNGFRAPSLYELAYKGSPSAAPPAANLTLQEEKSRGFDAGIEYHIGEHTRLIAVYFNQQIKDEIYFDLLTFSGYLQSLGANESTGVELSAQYQRSNAWALSTNFTYNHTETGLGDPRIRRPKQLANASLSLYPYDNLALHLSWRTSRGARANDGSKLDDYNVVDISSSYRLAEAVVLYARMENALDESYQEVLGYNTAGSATYLGAKFTF
jgi:vitamin B12 transporter